MANANSKLPIICLMGPTAAGKTPLAVELVQRYPLSIISVDSAMVYRDMNIGTAKPSADILKIAPHHLIDVLDPKEIYSAGRFRTDALSAIQEIHAQERIPLLVGGTMMYFRVLQQGFASLPLANTAIRARIQTDAYAEGWEALHRKLQTIDPEAAARIKVNDKQRIQRALEVFLATGKTISSFQTQNENPLGGHQIFNLVLAPNDRVNLHERIALRFSEMLAQGFVEEVKGLHARGDLTKDLPAMRAVGYREIWEHLENERNYTTMCEKAIAATRQLAKRQLTWCRSWPEATWFESDASGLFARVEKWVKRKL